MHWMTAAKVKATAALLAAALGTTLRIGRFVAPFATPRTWFYATNYETAGELPQPFNHDFLLLDFGTKTMLPLAN